MDNLSSLISHSRDIESLHQENSLLRTLIEHTYDPAIFVLDPEQNFRFILVNDAVCRHFGISREQIYKLSPADIDPHFGINELGEQLTTLKQIKTLTFETEHHLPSGQTVPVEIMSNYFEFKGKALIIGYFRDISLRKEEEKRRTQEQAQRQQLILERQYQKVFDKLAYEIYLLEVLPDNTLKVLDINESAMARMGNVIGSILDEVLPEQNKDDYLRQKEYCLKTGLSDHYEGYFCYIEKRHFDITMTPIKDESGHINRIILVKRDVTEKKRREAENLLREQEIRALVEHSRDVIVRYDTQFRRIYANPAYLKLAGASSLEEVKGKTPLEDMRMNVDAHNLYQMVMETIRSKQSRDVDLSWSDSEEEYYYEIHLIPEFNSQNEVTSILCVGRDYSRRRKAELALQKREEEFRSLVENSPDTISRHTLDGRRIYMNPRSARMAGTMSEIILNTTPLKYPGGEEGKFYYDKIQEVIRTGENSEFELNWTSKKGNARCYLLSLAPERNIHGEIVSVLAIGRDITLLKQFRQELEQSRTQLRELVAHRELTRESERKHIAREVHDELGQRLTALKMEVQTLEVRYSPCAPELQKQLNRIQTHLRETISFARNLVSRLRPSALDMGFIAALEWLTDDFQQRSPNCKCMLTLNCNDVGMNEDVATAVFRIVQESLTNVIKHANASRVHILLHESPAQLLLSIQDNGQGFDTTRHYKESFGLVGIKERVLMIHADLNIQSTPGKGTCIELRIPLNYKRYQ
ncbi:PAS domain-containing sensor histidine kinase [Vibrio mangrovi]|uniref:PAS domain-containing protein n=1 Tax=Vibrio mangrovi TaxID=474394 RepID=A0A1Y6IY00_9VIBR|nr:PAS domain-containing protein [Vibrio mangrovi]MDW6001956.1 PAS domain-containing protein [Vibrio mangrovi]SMS02496.1 Sensor histidine kinase LiaS [Vibrio mangrovi]